VAARQRLDGPDMPGHPSEFVRVLAIRVVRSAGQPLDDQQHRRAEQHDVVECR